LIQFTQTRPETFQLIGQLGHPVTRAVHSACGLAECNDLGKAGDEAFQCEHPTLQAGNEGGFPLLEPVPSCHLLADQGE